MTLCMAQFVNLAPHRAESDAPLRDAVQDCNSAREPCLLDLLKQDLLA